MSWRKITVDGNDYRWRYGSSFLVIRDAEMRTVHRVPTHEAVGMTHDQVERAMRKRYFCVTPQHVADAIRSRA